MSEVKLVKRFARASKEHITDHPAMKNSIRKESEIRLVAIGASTGGPPVLQKILSGLPKNFPVPILIVQHISHGFVEGFVEWLQMTTTFPLHIASHGEYPLPGHGYIAPDDFHMGIESGPKIVLSNDGLENGLRPSVAYLFRSVAHVIGSGSVGILLTGMGRDGADELKLMKENGAVTIAQDKESSVVHGMPGEAIKIGGASYIFSPENITTALTSLMKNKKIENIY
jgi:two-component system, chemotaxis family, protein-glutamate methylesterase/glutaminase